jgi:hypothetical protein
LGPGRPEGVRVVRVTVLATDMVVVVERIEE